ncbi:MAG: hypothetical protein SPE24_05245 [Erysipelotrichaceae bacterium]|nr:hypothetical protein [Erysipelotrichaceae bacterium]
MSRSRTKELYTIFIATLPLFSVYASGVPGFTLGDIILFAFFLYRIFIGVKNKSINISTKLWPIVLLVVMMLVLSIISMFGQNQVDVYSVGIRIIRRVFYYLSVVLVSSEWFDADYGKKVIVSVGKVGTIYLFIQYIAYYVGHIVLHGYLPFLPVYHENYAQLDYQALYHNMFRPTSFLLEPAHFARYLCIPLILTVFDGNREKKWLWAFVMSGAIIASTSGTGTICVAFIWGIWLFKNLISAFRTGKIDIKYIVLFIVLTSIVHFSIKSDIVQSTIQRITNTRLTDINTAGGARFRGYLQYFQLPLFNLIVGKGYGSTPDTVLVTWFSGASYILYGCGLIGFLVCVLMFIKLFDTYSDVAQRALCIIFFLLFFVDDCFMSHVSVTFLTFICMNSAHNLERTQSE